MRTKFSGILTLFLAFMVQLTFAQQKTVSGTVTDDQGMPLPGVNIVIKGTTTGTQSDFDGNYSLQAATGDVLVFSYVGFTTQEITVGAQNNYSLALEPGNVLDEVVVVGYGMERQAKSLTVQTQKVDSEELTVVEPQNVAQSLTGKVAGLQINNTSNGVNPSNTIVLRGFRSITQGNDPLIVMDGTVVSKGTFDNLNPNDVESINVLKGAMGATLYGAAGANGALIVTTKKGASGKDKREKFTIALNSSTMFTDIAYMPDFQTEYGSGWQGEYDNIENTNWGPRFDGVVRQIGPTLNDGTFQSVPYAPVQDNLRDFYDTGVTTQNTVSLNGGSRTDGFYASIGEQNSTGVIPNDEYTRNTFRFNASKKLGDVTLSVNSNYVRAEEDVVGGAIGAQNRPIYWFILNTPNNIPLSDYRDWRNNKFAHPNGYYNGYYENPYWAVDTHRNVTNSDRLVGNMAATWDVAEWVTLTSRVGLNRFNTRSKSYSPGLSFPADITYSRPNAYVSFVQHNESQYIQYTSNTLAEFKFNLTEKIAFNPTLGVQTYSEENIASVQRGNDLSIDGFYDISNRNGEATVDNGGSRLKTLGYFAQLAFSYNDYLFLDVNGRYDFTSTLRDGDNEYFYPGFGLSFVASDAFPSMKDSFMNYLKLTASNATVYNDLAAFAATELYTSPGGFPFLNTNGFVRQGVAVDENIVKEKINTTEFGANMSFLKNRINLDVAYFKTITTDLITTITPSSTSGASGFLTNIGELEGDGLEIGLNTKIINNRDARFSWDLGINYTAYKTVVNEVTDQSSEVALVNFPDGGIYAVEGEQFPLIKGSSYERDPQGRIVIDPATGNPIIGDSKILGQSTPDYVIGLNSTIKFRDFTLSTTWDYRTGHHYWSQLAQGTEFVGRSMESVSANRQNFVIPNSVYQNGTDGQGNPIYVENTNIPVTGGRQDYWTNHYNQIAENYVIDATAVKLRELALKYDVPQKFLDNTFVNRLSIGVVGRNLLTWLPEQNRFSDPEFNNEGLGNGIGVGGYLQGPPTRQYGFNVNLEF